MADAKSDSGDVKDKFRQALEKKRSSQSARADEAHAESKIHGEHGAVGGKRTFRRKSGG
jgi:Family of unknown function (DUF5302)